MTRLYWKFLLFLLLAQFTTLFSVNAAFWLDHKRHEKESQGIEISPPARSVIETASATLSYGGVDALKSLLTAWQHGPMPKVLAVDNQDKEILGRGYSAQSLEAAKALISSKSDTDHVKKIEYKKGQSIILFVPERSHAYSLTNGESIPPHRLHQPPPDGPPMIRGRNLKFPFTPLIIGLMVSIIFAAFLAWYFSKPITILQKAFSQAAKGHLDLSIHEAMGNRKDAFADLAFGFDSMALRLNSLLQGQKRLLSHISHELRSPLARIQIAIGLAKQDHHKVERSIDRIQQESDRMDNLIGELLQLSRFESKLKSLNKSKIKLNTLMEHLVEDARFEANEDQITIITSIQDDIYFICDAELIYRAIENVIRNAIKYTHPKSQINVDLSINPLDNQITLQVNDQGDGVQEKELTTIFEPFMRTTNAKNKDGYGVGLAMAKQIVEAHNGRIYAKNLTEKSGLSIIIKLPLID